MTPQRQLTSSMLERLEREELTLPARPPKPGGNYVPVRIAGTMAFVAAQFPIAADGTIAFAGRLGDELTTEDGVRAAEIAALNVLGQMQHYVGLERIRALARFEAYLVTARNWDDFPVVVDGASNIFLRVLGPEIGAHSRALFGVERLPLNMPIELTAIFEIHPEE